MKTVFPTLAAAQKRARDLKAEFPMLQIKVYDAEKKTRTLVESDKRLSPSRSEARQWLASRIFACAGIDLIEYLRTIASTLRWIERTREP